MHNLKRDLILQIESGVSFTDSALPIDIFSKDKNNKKTIEKNSKKTTNIEISDSAKIANDCKNLDELRSAIDNFKGLAIRKTATNTVFADGKPTAKVMLIGEAPGADEDKLGKPFVGRSGKLLDNMFNSIGLSRENNLYISNVINWRPPGNRPPTQLEIETCLPFLLRHIELVQPTLIIMLGATALKAVTGNNEPISKVRGDIVDINFADKIHSVFNRETQSRSIKDTKTITMYHPSYLLRSPSKKSIAMLDLIKIKGVIN